MSDVNMNSNACENAVEVVAYADLLSDNVMKEIAIDVSQQMELVQTCWKLEERVPESRPNHESFGHFLWILRMTTGHIRGLLAGKVIDLVDVVDEREQLMHMFLSFKMPAGLNNALAVIDQIVAVTPLGPYSLSGLPVVTASSMHD